MEVRFCAYMTERDEGPLLDFLRSSGGHVIHIFSPVWPPTPIATPPRDCGEDECLGIWYPECFSAEEFLLPECRPERGPHGRFDAWELPLITFQRMWYWRKQPTIFAVEIDYRAFRPGRPEEVEFSAEEIADFEARLGLLGQRALAIRDFLAENLRVLSVDGLAGEDAWQQSDELRQFNP